ncbi:MAG: hypothetical protein JO328_19055 [Hyphomicrobiales bacterium]|nr:hypothetical protein [Hyphomicrobiales bacterium]MBV8825676.1 hypothetical protein [Hyphomicrobiales bacterium]MBV9426920.1 hypothetical protein [Bradyrhizobiaceae bacterium]
MKCDPERLRGILPLCWSVETDPQWLPENPARGQCNATSLVVQDLCGGEILKTETPGGWHFYNAVAGQRHDLTVSQFATPVTYGDKPSNRAEALAGTTKESYALLKARVARLLA